MWFAVMNKFMQELDQRFLDTQEKKKHTPERKVRISGSLLASFPPPQAPKWTISVTVMYLLYSVMVMYNLVLRSLLLGCILLGLYYVHAVCIAPQSYMSPFCM